MDFHQVSAESMNKFLNIHVTVEYEQAEKS